jgi:hypothetical protein
MSSDIKKKIQLGRILLDFHPYIVLEEAMRLFGTNGKGVFIGHSPFRRATRSSLTHEIDVIISGESTR